MGDFKNNSNTGLPYLANKTIEYRVKFEFLVNND